VGYQEGLYFIELVIIINELLNKKPKTIHVTQLNVDDQVITGDTNIADCFNQYFSSIGCKL
jgi:hypothetical protein